MTASSVELFPCRVQLMGLPRSTTSASSTASESANLVDLSIGVNRRPPIQKVQRVSRNLFGAPDPTEMKNLYQQEAERQRKYVLGRYNFYTKSLTVEYEDNRKEYANSKNGDSNSSFKHPSAFPTLIEEEINQHDQRLQCKKQNRLCRISLEETPSNTKICSLENLISEVTCRCCEQITTLSPAVDHQKPYTRQSLLTERFNIRKSKKCLSRNIKCSSVGVVTTNSLEGTRNQEISQVLEGNASNSKHEADINCKKTRVNSLTVCKDQPTALSLKLIVSTQNLS